MTNLTYIECISANLLVSECCMCGIVTEYKDAQRELKIGDKIISHTYCIDCLRIFMDTNEFVDVDY